MIKFILTIILLSIIFILILPYNTEAKECKPSCNQKLYDQIYYSITVEALNSKDMDKANQIRNQTIEQLRKLCNGQKSSYEVGK